MRRKRDFRNKKAKCLPCHILTLPSSFHRPHHSTVHVIQLYTPFHCPCNSTYHSIPQHHAIHCPHHFNVLTVPRSTPYYRLLHSIFQFPRHFNIQTILLSTPSHCPRHSPTRTFVPSTPFQNSDVFLLFFSELTPFTN